MHAEQAARLRAEGTPMRIILRGGPLTGEIRETEPGAKTFTDRPGAKRPAVYDSTGQRDKATGLPIFVYRLPESAPGEPSRR